MTATKNETNQKIINQKRNQIILAILFYCVCGRTSMPLKRLVWSEIKVGACYCCSGKVRLLCSHAFNGNSGYVLS